MIRRLLRDRHAGISLLTAAGMPLLIGFSAFAVDLGSVTLEARRLQGMADAAALAAATDPAHGQARAEASVAQAGWPRPITVTMATGRYARDAATPVDNRFTADAGATDAVRVVLDTPSPTYFATIFGLGSVPIARSAIAARQRLAAFSIGSRLASLDGGILNGLLSGLTGSNVSLSVMDYEALARADVDLFGYLDALRTTAGLGVATYDQTLATRVTAPVALNALATLLAGKGDAGGAAAARALALKAGSLSLSLDALIGAGRYGGQTAGGEALAGVDGLAFVTALLETASGARQVSLDLGAGVNGLASTRVTVAIGERPRNSPWIAVAEDGTSIVRTAQTRIYVEAKLLDTSLPLIGPLVAIRLPVFVEAASGEARLAAIDCATKASTAVTLEARTSAAAAAIAAIDTSKLSDFSTPMTFAPARLVDTLLIDLDAKTVIDAGATEPWQRVAFDKTAIDERTIHTVSSSRAVGGIAASLATKTELTPYVLGLPLPLGPLLRAVTAQLSLVAPAIDGLLNLVTGAVGVNYGEADLTVTGVRCGTPMLVA